MILKGNLVADFLYDDRPEIKGKYTPYLFIKIDEDNKASESYLHSILRAANKWGVKTKVGKRWDEVPCGACFIDLGEGEGPSEWCLTDVDAKSPVILQMYLIGEAYPWTAPCTPEAILEFLDFYEIPVRGRSVCIIGRGDKVGRPLATMLMNRDATVTVCHSKTPEPTLRHNLLNADIIIEASGKKHLFGVSDVRCGATVINVGGGFDEPEGDFQTFTLVPFVGGIGPVTTAMLMTHVLMFEKSFDNGFSLAFNATPNKLFCEGCHNFEREKNK